MKKRNIILGLLSLLLVGCNTPKEDYHMIRLENDFKIETDTIDVLKLDINDCQEGVVSARVLQGVINKEKVRVYYYDYREFTRELNLGDARFDILDTAGLNYNYLTLDNKNSHNGYTAFWTLFNKYKDEIENIYVYESYSENPIVSDSMNVAAMLAGRNHGVAVDNTLYEALVAEGYAKNRKVINVVKQFGFADENSPFYSNFGINKWISQYMIEGSNKEFLFLLSTSPRDPESSEAGYHTAYDYAVATDSLIYCINPLLDAQVKLQATILSQFPDNAYVIGWPGINMEATYVKTVSKCGKGVVCADWSYANGSVFAAFDKYTNNKVIYPKTDNEEVYKDKVYISFTLSDGDAWHYMTREFLAYFASPIRGSIPIGWEVSSLFSYVNPLFLKYFYDNATENDEIMQGVGGITYIQPSNYPDDAYQGYLLNTKQIFAENNISTVNFWDENNGSYSKDSQRIIDYCNVVNPNAMVLGHAETTNDYYIINDTVCMNCMGFEHFRGTQNAEEVVANVDKAIAHTPSGQPVFANINIEAWGEGVSTIQKAYDELTCREDGYKYEFVLPYQMANLIRSYEKHGANKVMSDEEKVNYTSVSFLAASAEEANYTFPGWDNGSRINASDPNKVNRYADNDATFAYKFNVNATKNLIVTIDMRGQFIISISKDGTNWTEAVKKEYDSGDCSPSINVFSLIKNYEGVFYLKFEDSDKSNGFGPGVYRVTYKYK